MRRKVSGIVFVPMTGRRHSGAMRDDIFHAARGAHPYGRMTGRRVAPHGQVTGPGMSRTPEMSWTVIGALLAFAFFFLSWRVFRFSAVNITASDVALSLCAIILVLRGQLNPLPFGNLTIPWLAGLALMLGGLLIGTLANGEAVRWAAMGTQYLFAFAIIPMVLMSADRRWLRRCAVFFVVGVAISQAIGVVAASYLTFADTSVLTDPGFITPNGRVGSMSGEPNVNGAVCAFAFPILVNAVQRREMSWKLALPCAIAIVWGLLATASVTGFAASAIAVAIVLGMSGVGTLARIGIPIVLLAAAYVFFGGPLPEAFDQRVTQALVTGDPSKAGTYTGRTALVVEAWDLAEGNMLVGLGADGYRHTSALGLPTHVLHLIVLNEGGAIAFIGLEAMLAVLVIIAVSIYRENRVDGAMCLAVVAVFLLFTLSIPHMYTRSWIVPVFLALACAMARERVARIQHNDARPLARHSTIPGG